MNATLALAKAAGAWVLWNSAGAAVLVVLVAGVQYLLGPRVSARWRHNLWLLVVVRLMLPALPGVRVHLPTWAKAAREARAERGAEAAAVERHAAPASVSTAPASEPPAVKSVSPGDSTPAEAFVVTESLPAADRVEMPEMQLTLGVVAADVPIAVDAPPGAAEPKRSPVATGPITSSLPAAPPRRWSPVDWAGVAAVVWLVGLSALLGRLAWASVRLARGTRRLDPLTDPAVNELVAECCRAVRIHRVPRVLDTKVPCSPALVGVWRPTLLLPPGALADFGERGLRLIVLHELAHLKRRDVATNYLLSLVQAVHWFNPLVWFAAARVRGERELACDEAVLRVSGAPAGREYGQTILKLIESLSRGGALPAPAPAGAVGVVQHRVLMQRRLTMIAKFDPTRRGRPFTGAVLSLALGGAMVASAVRAQDAAQVAPPPPPPVPVPTTTAPPAGQSLDEARRAVDAAASPPTADPFSGGQLPPLTPPPTTAAPLPPSAPTEIAPPPTVPTADPARPPTPTAMRPAPPVYGQAMRPGALPPAPQTTAPPPTRARGQVVRSVDDPAAAQANAKTTEKLRKTASPTFESIPLRDCLAYFADEGKLDIVTDNRALDSAQSMDTPISLRIREPRPLDQVLQLVLRMGGPELDYSLVNGVVFISTRAELARHFVTRAYDIGEGDHSSLDRIIGNATGGAAEIWFTGSKLLVTASEPDQREIAKLLAIVPGGGANQRRAVGQTGAGAADVTNGRIMNLFALKYAEANDVAAVLSRAMGPAIVVTPDARTNSLIINGPAANAKAAIDMAAKLDQPKNGGQAASPVGAGMDKAQAALANMRTLVERFSELTQKMGPRHPQVQEVARKIESYGTELDRLASSLTKDGKDAEAAAIRDQMEMIKKMLEPYSSDPQFLTPPAAKR